VLIADLANEIGYQLVDEPLDLLDVEPRPASVALLAARKSR
jgi:hypothetical protein